MRFFLVAAIVLEVLLAPATSFPRSPSHSFAASRGNYFEPDGDVFLARGAGSYTRVGPTGIEVEAPTGNVSVTFIGARRAAKPEPQEALRSVSHYMIGDQSAAWRLNVARYERIRFSEIYDGIDLIYHHERGGLEYDFAVSPGVDPNSIRLRIGGADRAVVDTDGDLLLYRGDAVVRQKRPTIFQEIDGVRRSIDGSYGVYGHEIRFSIGAYDPDHVLVIDPEVSFSTHIGREGYADARKIAVDPANNIFIAGNAVLRPANPNPSEPVAIDIFLTKLDPAGNEIFTLFFGGGKQDTFSDLTVDSLGRVYLVGVTDSSDFPVVRPFGPSGQRASRPADGFVVRVNQNGAFEYSSYLGGNLDDRPVAIAVDPEFHAYITGGTYSADFPTTPGVIKRDRDPAVNHNPADAFVTKLAPDGQSLLFSTRLGGSQIIGLSSSEIGTAIAVDAFRNVYVAGLTNSLDFPLTSGALQQECFCSRRALDIFLTKLDPQAEKLLYGSYFGGRGSGGLSFKSLAGISIDTAGRLHVFGSTNSPEFPTTREPLGGSFEPYDPFQDFSAAFLSGIDVAAGQLTYSTFLGGKGNAVVEMDDEGRAYATGLAPAAIIPSPTDGFSAGDGVFAVIAPGASGIEFETRFRSEFAGRDLALSSRGDVYLLGDANYVSRLAAPDWQLPPLHGFANAARLHVKGKVSPGELIAIFGSGIGPEVPTGAQVDSNGDISASLEGTQVFIGGLPAPLIFAQDDQVNAVAPLGLLPGLPAPFEVRRNGVSLARINVDVVDADPAVFRSSMPRPNTREISFAAALNQDGTVNSPDNPAAAGTIIAVFGTGFGALNGAIRDGEIRLDALPRPQLPVTAHYNSFRPDGPELAVHYAGQAPGLVAGVIQVNIHLPMDIAQQTDVPISLAVGERAEYFHVFVKP